jgi:lipoprotein-anchoring transpeptidase ErfK/SrfK
MKNSWKGILLAVLILVVGGALFGLVITGRRPFARQAAPLASPVLAQLPPDKGLAQKELARVKKALAGLKPVKPYIVIDTHANRAYLRTQDSILYEGTCSTGSGGMVVDSATGRKWIFNTPHGVFKVNSKLAHPWWRKPDWAFIEENEPIPKDEAERYDPEMLGEFAMGFGHGYFIHGTIYERLLGINVTHGCVRLGSDDLKYIYDRVQIGTPVYIF